MEEPAEGGYINVVTGIILKYVITVFRDLKSIGYVRVSKSFRTKS